MYILFTFIYINKHQSHKFKQKTFNLYKNKRSTNGRHVEASVVACVYGDIICLT